VQRRNGGLTIVPVVPWHEARVAMGAPGLDASWHRRWRTNHRRMSWGARWAAAPPESGKIIFFGQSSNFPGRGQKMKNNILKIINEKYEKYSIGYSKKSARNRSTLG